MIPFLKNKRINFPIAALSILILSLVVVAFADPKKGRGRSNSNRIDPQAVSIPSGSFYMGASDEQMDLSMVNRKKLVSVQSFWMDRTEVTNEQYRRFVKYVADSLKYLAIYGGGINQNEDTIRVDWARAARINQNSKAVLEKLNELNIQNLNLNTHLKIGKDFGKQTIVEEDTSSSDGLPSIANYIKKILLVSDNDAYNRLYEFVGRKEINEKLKRHGFNNSRIISRLSVGDSGENARYTNPFTFYDKSQEIYHQPQQFDSKDYPLKLNGLLKGKGYLDGNDSLILKPFNFADKNAFALKDQHLMMQKLMFPESFPESKRFNLNPKDYEFLYTYMSRYPTDNIKPTYQSQDYYPTYCKFLYYGADKNISPNPNIRIFNKVGDAYGYTIDNMYFVDFENNIEFILSAVIQSNNNQIYNDNTYEYETICLPFLKNLGQMIYDLELKRDKKIIPNFDKFLPYK